ncbi:formate dehydrogenase accessory sulfurtransferase FdhD [Desulfatiferula olefinivorans]
MKVMQPHIRHEIRQAGLRESVEETLDLIVEAPLTLRIQGRPHTVIMRTPGDEIALAAGFCLGEGLLSSPEDIEALSYGADGTDTVDLSLSPGRPVPQNDAVPHIGQAGGGLRADHRTVIPIGPTPPLDLGLLFTGLSALPDFQPVRTLTRAAHGAALFDGEGQVLASAEDVGRHNALDKVIGKALLEKKLGRVAFLVLSSRISLELVQKAAMARIPVVAAVSRPTATAVALAKRLDMALVCRGGPERLFVFCGNQRLN